jgi:isoquinoline 1-oxidoreductase beta subunit
VDHFTFDDSALNNPSRRGFLKTSGAAALVVGFGCLASADARWRPINVVFLPNAYLRITPDSRVTVVCGSAEMGQGVLTAIPMLLAEELDADWSKVSVEQAPVDKAYNNPMFGMQVTGGSTTVRAHWEPLRKAGAAAREMLVAAAAAQWKVDAASLRTENGQVISDGKARLRRAGCGRLKQAVPASERKRGLQAAGQATQTT